MSTTIKSNGPIILRDYSKAIFFYPLFLISVLAWIIQYWQEKTGNDGGASIEWLAVLWLVTFFANLFVVSFDFNAMKTLVLFLVVVLIGLIVWILVATGKISGINIDTEDVKQVDFGVNSRFYGAVSILLGIILFFVILASRFKYVKIETNEIYVKGIQGRVERYSTSGLRWRKTIPDVFEFLSLGAGKIEFYIPNQEPITLNTVPLVNLREKQLDNLLSSTEVTINQGTSPPPLQP